eukprot:scaffold19189_cov35-Cyclotella_meneghiniana.AAC.1
MYSSHPSPPPGQMPSVSSTPSSSPSQPNAVPAYATSSPQAFTKTSPKLPLAFLRYAIQPAALSSSPISPAY